MPIYQVNLFICEVCGKTSSTTETTFLYFDPIVIPPNEKWEYIDTEKGEKLACPDCSSKKEQKKSVEKLD